MRIEGETGFVLHARPWRETSLLVEVLSAGHGRIGLVARGVHSPKRQVLRAARSRTWTRR
jgi:DNA repair protein RecO (recombination protein O)